MVQCLEIIFHLFYFIIVGNFSAGGYAVLLQVNKNVHTRRKYQNTFIMYLAGAIYMALGAPTGI